MKITRKKNTVRANRKITNRGPIKAAAGSDMLEDIRLSKDAFIQEWQNDYTGTPKTSWDNIFENLVNDFELYADDEASSHYEEGGFYGPTIQERWGAGEISSEEVMWEFDEWLMGLDLSDYDY